MNGFKERVPKKVKLALEKLEITNVVGGYQTRDRLERAAYTCWDEYGYVVCVLYKGKGDPEWRL